MTGTIYCFKCFWEQGSENTALAKSSPSLVLIFSGMQPQPFFHYCLWLLSCYKGRVKQLRQRTYGPRSIKYLLLDPSQKKKKCWAWVKEFIHKRKAKRNWHGIVDTLRAFKPLSNLDRKCISKWWVAATWRHIGEEVRLVVWKPLR